jgi:phosphoribosylpyrophosphate synthetase
MQIKEEFNKLIEKLKIERDEVNLKIHLASMDAKKEYEEAEKKWVEVKAKASLIADDAVETSEEVIAKVKIVGEELKGTYSRISSRLSK